MLKVTDSQGNIRDITKVIKTEEVLPEYKADRHGTEEILSSGKSVSPILSINYEGTRQEAEFTYRQTGGGTLTEDIEKAKIEKVKGNTVAWNQNIPKAIANGSQGWIINSGTWDANHSVYSITNAQAGVSYFYWSWYLDANHKYYASLSIKGSSGVNCTTNYMGTHTMNGDWQRISAIVSVTTSQYSYLNAYPKDNCEIAYKNEYMVIDLTLIYGAGKEPTSVAQFEADYQRWFGKPLTYEEYDAGSLRPVNMTGVKSVGFNLFDEGTFIQGRYRQPDNTEMIHQRRRISDVYFSCLPNTEYYLCTDEDYALGQFAVVVCWYDSDKNFISGINGSNKKVTSPSNAAYFRVSSAETYTKACINISNSIKDGTYKPYASQIKEFDVTTLTGKLNGAGSSVTIFPDGMKKAGSVYDEIKIDNGVVKAVKRVGSVDLGQMVYALSSSRFNASLNNCKSVESWNGIGYINSKYEQGRVASDGSSEDKMLGIYSGRVFIKDSSYTDATTFQAAMQGVMLYYELATPEEYVLDIPMKEISIINHTDSNGNIRQVLVGN